ncbi:MAG: patatin family protein [Oscillospiraceae bacterium]
MMFKAALVLEGGGMRGIYTAGILDFFLEQGLGFEKIYGVSAGSLNGANFVAKQKGRSLETSTDYLGDDRRGSMKNIVKNGEFFNSDFLYNQVPNKLNPFDYKTFAQSKSQLYAVLSNVTTGKPEYFLCRDMRRDMVYVRASSSLPLLAKIITIDGKKYLDGGICDSIPLRKSMEDGNEKNVVILTQHKGFVKQPSTQMGMNKFTYRNYPKFVTALEIRHLMYNNETKFVEKQQEVGNAFVIQPSVPLTVARLEKDAEKVKALYAQGYADAVGNYDKLMKYLQS